MIRMLLKEVAEAVESSAPTSEAKTPVRGVSIDSREVRPGDLFIAVRGEQFDGHDFIGQAAAKGATAFVCRRDKVGELPGDVVIPRLEVDDTIEALGLLAAYYRREVMPDARLGAGTAAAYELIRQRVPFLPRDAVLYPYMEAVRELVASGALRASVHGALSGH